MKISIKIEERIPLLEDILEEWEVAVGQDFQGYKNHVYRMINFCFAQGDLSNEAREKIVIAGCFHDLGIWSDNTFNYLLPSINLAKEFLQQNDLEHWISEVTAMIDTHHKLSKCEDAENPLVEVFRKGDLVDFSLGFVKCNLPKSYINSVKKQFPNAGFHKCLLQTASGWFFKHPLNPIPVLKW
jgi:hypothetical protein